MIDQVHLRENHINRSWRLGGGASLGLPLSLIFQFVVFSLRRRTFSCFLIDLSHCNDFTMVMEVS